MSPSDRGLRKPSRTNLDCSQQSSMVQSQVSSRLSQDDDSRPCPLPSSNPATQYSILEKLGTGSFGVVYKAIHNETKQIVAIKQIGTSPVADWHVP